MQMMENKLCVITGANSGIGYETALALAKRGAYILMVCRNEEKAEAARRKIIALSQNSGIEIILCDFSIQSEIRKATQLIREQYQKIDVLINNHGFLPAEKEETVDALEKTFAVNHIGYFLFTLLLLDPLKAADHGRIINVASEAHRRGIFDPSNLQLTDDFNPWQAYSNSKLFNIMFTHELARRLKGSQLTVNSLHPGLVASNFASEAGWLSSTFFKLGKFFMASPKKGARTSIYLATSDKVRDITGSYFKNRRVAVPLKIARDDQATSLLWDMSEKLCGLAARESLI